MQAEIITIGDEILIGQIIDTNSAYISKKLNEIGVSVYQITSIQDDETHILSALEKAESRVDIIIITGGLGPTKDDITKNTIVKYFNDVLVQDEAVLKNIEEMWRKYVKQPLSQINIDQALVPSKAISLMNFYGSAPGMWIKEKEKVFVSLPGVPYEMKALMKKDVLPMLHDAFELPVIVHKTLMTYGLGESMIANRIAEWEDALPAHIKLAYLPNLGRVRLRLSGKGTVKEKVQAEIDKQVEVLLPMIQDIFYGFENEHALEEQIGNLLQAKGSTLSTAESCTGGNLAQRFTAIAGASNYFSGSIVSYATSSKTDVLGVSPELIADKSVVSKEVAEAMAARSKEKFNSDYAIATTGNAGPTKGDADAEIGTVIIAISTPEGTYSEEFQLGNHRTKVIQKAVNKALEMLFREISKN